MDSGSSPKKMKMNESTEVKICKHYVKRKKRFCKMTVAKNKEYCGEHLSEANSDGPSSDLQVDRITCPLDPKHTVYRRNLQKHLKICNARPKDQPDYVVCGINLGPSVDDEPTDKWKLSEFSSDYIERLIERVDRFYRLHIEGNIKEECFSHDVLKEELSKTKYGPETMKHLIQTSSIIGCLQHFGLLQSNTSFIDFGSGKGQLSYWLAQTVSQLEDVRIILLDRASHRHKKDNKIEDKSFVQRIRADIADFNMKRFDSIRGKNAVVVVSKHLCGMATDLALRCIFQGQQVNESIEPLKIQGFCIALCCHHRCQWQSFVGKEILKRNGFDRKDFNLITKLVSWAICGSGMSRERRKIIEQHKLNTTAGGTTANDDDDDEQHSADGPNIIKSKLSLERRSEVGKMCKRLLDYCRLRFMENNGFEAKLQFYVKTDVTLENVCLIGKRIENAEIGK